MCYISKEAKRRTVKLIYSSIEPANDDCLIDILNQVISTKISNGEEALVILNSLDKAIFENTTEISDAFVEKYGEKCDEVYNFIISKFGTDEWMESYRALFPKGCAIEQAANTRNVRYLDKVSAEAVSHLLDEAKESIKDLYDFVFERGNSVCTFIIGKPEDDMSLLLEVNKSRDTTRQFVESFAMMGFYGGFCIIKCLDAKEVYCFANYDEAIAPVSSEWVDEFIDNNTGSFEGFTAKEYPPNEEYDLHLYS